jgi:hypothetical protein
LIVELERQNWTDMTFEKYGTLMSGVRGRQVTAGRQAPGPQRDRERTMRLEFLEPSSHKIGAFQSDET